MKMEPRAIVDFSKLAKKQLEKVPTFIAKKFLEWVQSLELDGIEATRRLRAYNDEALKGERKGQRSIRLSRSYRVIYEILNKEVKIIKVLEVNKHDY